MDSMSRHALIWGSMIAFVLIMLSGSIFAAAAPTIETCRNSTSVPLGTPIKNWEVPYIHQCNDTPNNFNGRYACGATSAVMILAKYSAISPKSTTCNTPCSSGGCSYGWYVSNEYTSPLTGITFYWQTDDVLGNHARGAYGYISDSSGAAYAGLMVDFFNKNGLQALPYISAPTENDIKSELDAGYPVVASTKLTDNGHIVVIKGYTSDGYYIVNDPFGKRRSDGKYETYGNCNGADVQYTWSEMGIAQKWIVKVRPPQSSVTLTLYVHDGSTSGPVISGATVAGTDAAGNSFNKVTNSAGYVTISGTPGTWSFTASKSGYNTNSWSQSITSTSRKDAYLTASPSSVTLTLYVHDGSTSGPVISGATVAGTDAGGYSFNKVTNSAGYVTISGTPGTWSFTASKSGYNTKSWSQSITSTSTKYAYLTASPSSVTLTLYVHDGSTSGPVISGATVAGTDAGGYSFNKVTNSAGYVTISGTPGTWSFTASKSGYNTKSWSQSVTSTSTKDAYLTASPSPVTLTLYVHEGSTSGPVISGATVAGTDAAGNSFNKVTNSAGYVTISGTPGTWSFTASKSGYNTNSWSQSITSTSTKDAYLTASPSSVTLTLYVHEGSTSGPVISGATVAGTDAGGYSFNKVTNSAGYVTISGTPGTWSFTASKSGYNTKSWSQSITSTSTKYAFITNIVASNSVAFQAANGQYLCAEGSGGREVVANRNAIGAWETFKLIDRGNGYYALQAANGQYLCAEGSGGGPVVANRDAIAGWETFKLIDRGNGYYALQAANGQYLCAEGGGGDGVVANRDEILGWETFRILDLRRPARVALQAYNGQYLCAEGGGGQQMVANRDAVLGWETFNLIDCGNGDIALQAYNGQYLCAEGGGGQQMVANRDAIAAWERFRLIYRGDGNIALQAYNGQYVCAEGGGGDDVVANRDWIAGWETFKLIPI